ncbi:hypothetical protein KM043_009158 [Ampulex compressa]|nr:hypothetical protein KM043_009158 [Ampulex compressa]
MFRISARLNCPPRVAYLEDTFQTLREVRSSLRVSFSFRQAGASRKWDCARNLRAANLRGSRELGMEELENRRIAWETGERSRDLKFLEVTLFERFWQGFGNALEKLEKSRVGWRKRMIDV